MGKMCGQVNSSTRMGIRGSIVAMLRATLLRIAADSKSMIDKATQLRRAAKARLEDPQAAWCPLKNPAGKPWGLQPDGDLWKILWEGLLTGGPDSITGEKVKGRAAKNHI